MNEDALSQLYLKDTAFQDLMQQRIFNVLLVASPYDAFMMEEDGRIALDKAGMLAYVHGEYFGLKKAPIGRFGFSVMKKKTKKRINKEKHQKRIEANRNQRKKKG
jgi:hypothetical protein